MRHLFSRKPRKAQRDHDGPRQRRAGESHADGRDHLLREPAAEQPIERRSCERQHRDDPEIKVRRHSLSRSTLSTLSVSRVRNTEIMMASPTAASAAATTITKNTKTSPES